MYTKGELLAEARKVLRYGRQDRQEEGRDASVLTRWYGDGRKPEEIYAAIHGLHLLRQEGAVDWIKPNAPCGLRALNRTRTLADQGDGKAVRLLWAEAVDRYYRELSSEHEAPKGERGGVENIADIMAKIGKGAA